MTQFLTGCFLYLVSATLLGLGTCHNGYSGKCPEFKAMESFDWDKFSGRWYAVEKFDTDSECLTYDFKEDEYDNREVLQISEHDTLKGLSIDNKVKYSGQLSFPHSNRESDMIVDFPISGALLDSASYKVLDTDYNNYGLVCSCQEIKIFFGLLTAHRRSCTVLQRKPQLNNEYSSKMHALVNEQLGSDNAAHDFDVIHHKNCNYEDNGKGLQIDVDEILESAKDEMGLPIEGTVEEIIRDIAEDGFGKEVVEGLGHNLPLEGNHPIV